MFVVEHVDRDRIRVWNPHTSERNTLMLNQRNLPESKEFAVGDHVKFALHDHALRSVERLERRTQLVRFRHDNTRHSKERTTHVIAANVDYLVVVIPANKIKTRLLDRYLIMAGYGNVKTILCINKTDLWKNTEKEYDRAMSVLRPYFEFIEAVCFVSAVSGEGLSELRMHLRDHTSVLSGQSGVGKSTIMNALAGYDAQKTKEIRAKDLKGRHATTSSRLLPLDDSTYLIDTPGIRQLESAMAGNDHIADYFPEILELSNACRFANCVHIAEPDCAVRDAAAAHQRSGIGPLTHMRYDSYARLVDPDGSLRHATSERWKQDGRNAGDLPWQGESSPTGSAQ